MRAEVKVTDFAKAVRALDLSATPRPRGDEASDTAPNGRTTSRDASAELTLEDAGFTAQPPARTYAVTRRRGPEVGRRPDARLHVVGHRRELASARVHQLRRRPRRVGEQRRRRCCRSTRATSATSRSGRRPIAPDLLMPTLLKLQPSFSVTPETRGHRAPTGRPGRSHRLARARSRRCARAREAPAWCGRRSRKGSRSPSRSRTARAASARRSSRSRTSASRSRTARRTRSSS